MATATGDAGLAKDLLAAADKVRKAATALLWNEHLGVFMASTGLERLNVRALPGRLGGLSVPQRLHMKIHFVGAFVWAHRALNRPFRWFPARAG